MAAVDSLKFTAPTPIQEKSIPILMHGLDLIGCAATGTGKTVAFAIPVIKNLESTNKTSLILCPTRELAMQIEEVFRKLLFNQNHHLVALVIGGASMSIQQKKLRSNPRVIIATPGRLVDHLTHGTANLSNVGMVVLDEADRMLDMGFAPQLDKVLRAVPRERQTVLFSATFPPETQKLAHRILRNPQKVVIGEITKPTKLVSHNTISTTHQNKNNLILDVLNSNQGSVLIFTRTKHRTDRLHRHLDEYGYQVSRIHGGRTQGQRNAAIKGFRENKFRILVATDVAARGIDVSNVSHVINFDLPQTPEDYIHRVGRAGRAGIKGNAISFLTPEDAKDWKLISKHISQRN